MDAKRVVALGVIGLAGYVAFKAKSIDERNVRDAVSTDAGSDNLGFINASAMIFEDAVNMITNTDNANLTPSFQVLEFLKTYEQLRLYPYDASGKRKIGDWTVGYGHKILKGEDFSKGISQDLANTMFINDLNSHIEKIYTYVKVKLTQGQFDALASLHFNVGPNTFNLTAGKKLLDAINAGDFDQAANYFMQPRFYMQKGVVLDGLYKRRAAEIKMFKLGIYERL